MRLSFAVAFLLASPCFAAAQDPATQAAQQATQQSQQAAMQAMHDTEEASRQASEANRRAMDEANHTQSAVYPLVYALPPKFSVKPGHYAGPITVRMTSAQRDSIIYYTTDGWKPSTASQRYRGPITISQTTTLCAIAVLPESSRTLQTSAQYIIAGTAPAPPPDVLLDLVELPVHNGVPFLPGGTSIPLRFAEGANSEHAVVGDHLTLSLTQDLLVGNVLVAAKGATATSTVVQVNRSGMGGAPGTLVVELDGLSTSFGPIPLSGSVTKEGDPKLPNAAFLIPVFGETQFFRHGAEAVIAPGGIPDRLRSQGYAATAKARLEETPASSRRAECKPAFCRESEYLLVLIDSLGRISHGNCYKIEIVSVPPDIPKMEGAVLKEKRMPKAKTTSETTKKPRKAAAKPAPTHDEIAERAYQIYQERGYTAGDPMQDWLQAEQELNAAVGRTKKAAQKRKVVSIAA